jgi:hypothetical protein
VRALSVSAGLGVEVDIDEILGGAHDDVTFDPNPAEEPS